MEFKKNNRFYLLDFFRGIAAIAIVIFHYKIFYIEAVSLNSYVATEQPLYSVLFLAYEHGWIAVQFFFTLSGFIFFNLYRTKILEEKISFKNFFILRFSRLYPLHLLMLILVGLFGLFKVEAFGLPNYDIKHLLLNLFLIQTWGFENGPSFNDPAWSISVEILMYCIFFFIAKTNKLFLPLSLLTLLLSIIIIFKYKFIGYGGFCFFIGGLSYLLYEKLAKYKFINKNIFKVCQFFLLLILIIIFIINKFPLSYIVLKLILLTFLIPSIIFVSVFFQRLNFSIFKKISLIGNLSYSIYMIHFFIQMLLVLFLSFYKIQISFNSFWVFFSYLSFCIIISFFSFNYFEKPLQKIIRKKLIV